MLHFLNRAGILMLAISLIACGGKSTKETTEEEATEEEVYEEAAEAIEETDESMYTLADLACFTEQGQLNLSNLYQFVPMDAEEMANGNESRWLILDSRWGLLDKFRHCAGLDNLQDWSALENAVGAKVVNRTAANKREDLLPVIEEEFLNVNPEFIRRASNLLIPSPNAEQANSLTYQLIYNSRLKMENRAMYLNWIMLQQYALVEHEMLDYVARGHTREVREDNTVFTRDYTDVADHLRYHFGYRMPLVNLMEGENSEWNHTYAGFWMRRIMDGSAQVLVEAQEKVLAAYDREWYTKIQGERKAMPKVTTIATKDQFRALVDQITEGISLEEEPPMDPEALPNVILSEDGFQLNFANGDSQDFYPEPVEYEEDEQSFRVLGYVPGHNAVLIEESGYEYSTISWISLKDGEQVNLQDFANRVKVSARGGYLALNFEGYEDYGMAVYDISSGTPKRVFYSPYFNWHEAYWLNNNELLISMEDAWGKLTFPKVAELSFEEAADVAGAEEPQPEVEGE